MFKENTDFTGSETSYDKVNLKYYTNPETFDEFVGNDENIDLLRVSIMASNKMKRPLDHILLIGPAGTGKTTLARIIAREKGGRIVEQIGPQLKQPFEIANILFSLKHNDILFIDEIHRMDQAVQEMLYGAMQDFKLGDTILPQFTLIGATTLVGKLTSPLVARFGLKIRLKYYSVENISRILKKAIINMDLNVSDEAIEKIAGCSRQTPRIAIRILKRVFDRTLVDNPKYDVNDRLSIVLEDVTKTLDNLKIDDNGLEDLHREYMDFLVLQYPHPVGSKTIAQSLDVDIATLEDYIEPWLVYKGFVTRTLSGRILSRYVINMKKYGIGDKIRELNNGNIPESKYHRNTTTRVKSININDMNLPFGGIGGNRGMPSSQCNLQSDINNRNNVNNGLYKTTGTEYQELLRNEFVQKELDDDIKERFDIKLSRHISYLKENIEKDPKHMIGVPLSAIKKQIGNLAQLNTKIIIGGIKYVFAKNGLCIENITDTKNNDDVILTISTMK